MIGKPRKPRQVKLSPPGSSTFAHFDCAVSPSPTGWKTLAWLLIVVLTPGSSVRLSAQAIPASPAAQAPSFPTGPGVVPSTPAGLSRANVVSSTVAPSPVAYTEPFDAPRSSVRRCRVCRHAARPFEGHPVPAYQVPAHSVPKRSVPAHFRPAGLISTAPLPGALFQAGQPGPPVAGRDVVMVDASSASDVLHIPVGRSIVMSTGAALRRIYVGDPKVLHSFASGPREDVITARGTGISTLILWDQAGRRRMYTVFADLDTDGLSKAIADALPNANVSVASKTDRVYLSGTVSTDAEAEALGKLAAMYSKTVVDGVRVLPLHGRQIELKLRIVEVDRSRLAQYGVNFFALGGSTLGNTSTQQFSTTVTPPTANTPLMVSDPLNLLLYSAKLNAGVTIKDLEQKQILQVLAEPTLTTLSGVSARFLSGGEFPLPVVQGGTGNSTAITIVWKPYGVKVEFTPTANADGTIRLKVAPEVSALDYTNAVTISGFTIPALSTRKAETEVELQDGQSFVISGLLDHRTTDSLSRMPGIASVPILGQLFRSKGVTLSTVDLVVMVTATVVDPLAHALAGGVSSISGTQSSGTQAAGAKTTGAITEPKMVIPNLDNDRFDRDVNQTRRGRKQEPAADSLPQAVQP